MYENAIADAALYLCETAVKRTALEHLIPSFNGTVTPYESWSSPSFWVIVAPDEQYVENFAMLQILKFRCRPGIAPVSSL